MKAIDKAMRTKATESSAHLKAIEDAHRRHLSDTRELIREVVRSSLSDFLRGRRQLGSSGFPPEQYASSYWDS